MQMNSKQQYLPLLLTLILGIGFLGGYFFRTAPQKGLLAIRAEMDSVVHIEDRFQEIVRYIDAKYYKHVDEDVLVNKAIKRLVAELDPFSSYLSREEVILSDAELKGEFGGVGIHSCIINDTIFVSNVLPIANFVQNELKPGDAIVGLDSFSLAGMSWDSIRLVMMGPVDSVLSLQVLRNSEALLVKTKRVNIIKENVSDAFMIDSTIGFLRIEAFNDNTYRQFIDSLEYLYQQGARKLVLDVRDNPGGYLKQAVQVANQFMRKKDMLIVYTQGEQNKRSEYFSTGRVFFPVDKVAILINEHSASAAEVVAGAIQDNDIGMVIGQPSYGKGLVQNQFTMRDGAGLKLTVAKYYTPSGRCIQKEFDQEASDSSIYFTLNGREVQGGGGILPDIKTPSHRDILGDSAPEILESARLYAAYKNVKKVDLGFDLFSFIKQEGILDTFTEAQRQHILDYYTTWELQYEGDKTALYEAFLKTDKALQEAIKFLKTDTIATQMY